MLKGLRLILISALFFCFPVFAGALSVLESTSIQLTNYSADAETNIDLTFTAVADNDDASGYLEVVFNDFDLTGLGEDDVDLLVDSVQQDIEGCVTIDADSVTVGDWTCLGLDPSDGEVFRLLIGTNTSHESVGDTRITTPDYSSGGQYMSIVATMVDGVSGSSRSYFAIPIYDGSSGSIGATVGGGGSTYGIDLTSPTAGASFRRGDNVAITWDVTDDPIGYIQITYTSPQGDDIDVTTGEIVNTGIYNWTLPSGVSNTSSGQILLEGTNGSGSVLASDTVSNIVVESSGSSGCTSNCSTPDPVYEINLLTPEAGDEYLQGEQINITWETTEDPINYVTLYYQADISSDDYVGTDNFTIATNVPNTGSYVWTIPGDAHDTDEAYIFLSGTDLSSELANDNAGPFTVGEPVADAITVSRPNGGESYEVGDTVRISWVERGDESRQSIELSRDGGETWEELNDFVQNFGAGSTFEDWIATGPATDEALVRVNGQVLSDVSDNVFSISEPVEDSVSVISPNGGEIFTSGDDVALNWSVDGDVSLVDLFIWNGDEWLQVADDIDANLQTYTWTSPADMSTEEALLRAVSATDALIADESDAVFSILPEEEVEISVRVLYPNGGEEFSPGQTITVRVDSTGEYDAIDLFVTLDGVNYNSVLTNAPVGSSQFSWQVPNTETASGYIRANLISEGATVASDISDGPFSIIVDEVPPPEPPVEPEPPTVDSDQITGSLQFLTFDGGLILPDQGGRSYDALTGVTLLARAVDANRVATSAEISLNGRVLQMNSLGAGVFELPIVASDVVGAVIFLAEDDREVLNYGIDALPYGLVFDSETGEPVFGALSFVLSQAGNQVDVSAYGFSNPAVTSTDGAIGWMLPNGVYEVTVAKDGYRSDSRVVSVSNLVLSPRFALEMLEDLPPEPPVEPTEPVEPQNPDGNEDVVAAAVAAISGVVGETVKAIQQSPTANVLADVSEPAIIVTSAAGIAVLAGSFGALSYLQYLFTAPLLFFTRRKRNATGIIYNAITKVPLGLATIRVFDELGKLVKSLVSDPRGYFSIKLPRGRYSIQVIKEGFIFPSQYLNGKKSDESYVDLYTGGLIEVDKDGALLSINIPLDPDSVSAADLRGLYLKRFLRIFQTIASHLGIIIAIFVVIVQPSTLAYLLLTLQVVLYIGTRVLIAPHGSRGWGLVKDAETGKPLKQAVVRLFEPKFNKLIETQITDRKGRYSMTAGPNAYYLTSQKDGYEEKKIDNIDYSSKKDPEVIAVDISLEPKGENDV